ncbi:MAG: SRPBCC family protein [Nannocystaceae bacterium]|nr:SRPBCC family protein [Myxococcales bacterium]
MKRFVYESVIPAPVADVFAFHERPDALALLTPPWERVEIVQPPTSLEVGVVVILRQRLGPIPLEIVAEHVAYEKNARFEDVMRRGPFRRWHHRHLFFEHEDGCLLRDEIDYALPIERIVDRLLVRPRLQRLFEHRHAVTRRVVLGA